MKPHEFYWSLYNEITGSQIDRLTFVQAKSVVDSIPENLLSSWIGWHEGLSEWRELSEFAELFSVTQTGIQPPQAPWSDESDEFSKTEISAGTRVPGHSVTRTLVRPSQGPEVKEESDLEIERNR